jgi:deoxyribodipyrimidine photo-lyase
MCRMTTSSRPAIVWFRRDLRLLDNPALHAAVKTASTIVPVFVLPDPPHGDLGSASLWWLHGSLAALQASLAAKGAKLILRRGNPAQVLPEIAAEKNADCVHAGLCPEPGWRAADAATAQALSKTGRTLHLHQSLTLFDLDVPKTRAGGNYGMYTPYANAVRALDVPAPLLPEPDHIPCPPNLPASDLLDAWKLRPTRPDWAAGLRQTWTPGEAAARARGKNFLRGAARHYDSGRNLPGQDLTSLLSPHLRWGELSVRGLWKALHRHAQTQGEKTFANELIWRDFAAYLLWHHPDLATRPLRPEFENLPWRNDPAGLRAWQRGQTGVPIVDAGMRQLWQTGWMHNRVRMVTASFLVKHLLIDWREGAAWFMDTLVDADLAANSMNWQWVAGTGIDSQPFFRVFNPVSQGEKFDTDGAYVRRFVPELAQLPDKFIHAPWTAPPLTLHQAGVSLGQTYPTPIVDLAAGRERALATWKSTVRVAA